MNDVLIKSEEITIQKFDFSVIRHERPGHTILLNSVIQLIREAPVLGLWAYLSSLPPNWVVVKEHLMAHFGVGRDKLQAYLKKMKDYDLIEIKAQRDGKGCIVKWHTIIKWGVDISPKLHKAANDSTGESSLLKTRILDDDLNKNSAIIQNTENPEPGKTASTNTIYIKNKIYKHTNARVRDGERKKIDSTPFLAVYHKIAAPLGCPRILNNQRVQRAIQVNLEKIATEMRDDEESPEILTAAYFEVFLNDSIKHGWFVLTEKKYGLDILLRPSNFMTQREVLRSLSRTQTQKIAQRTARDAALKVRDEAAEKAHFAALKKITDSRKEESKQQKASSEHYNNCIRDSLLKITNEL